MRAWCEAASGVVDRREHDASGWSQADLDEDDVVLDVWEKVQRPGLRLLLVPRRPERFDMAAEKLSRGGSVSCGGPR